jgi:hypothetical protein
MSIDINKHYSEYPNNFDSGKSSVIRHKQTRLSEYPYSDTADPVRQGEPEEKMGVPFRVGKNMGLGSLKKED